MSFDIMLQRFENGQSAVFGRRVVDEIFDPFVVHRDPSFIRVKYPDRSGADIWIGEDETDIGGIMFNHCGGEQFANAFFELLRRTGSVIYWPGGGCVVADPAVAEELPARMVQALGEPKVVRSGRDIFECIIQS